MYSVYKSSHSLAETGGLLRVAVKLMMACASQNTNVFAALRPLL
jgi:hypothetical protein